MKLIHDEWKTKISVSTDDNGEIKFRGFYGNYDIMLKTADGIIHYFKMHLSKNEENKRVFIINN